MNSELLERIVEIKVDLLSICMGHIRNGQQEIKNEAGEGEDSKNRVARAIKQLCRFIDEFEGVRDRAART